MITVSNIYEVVKLITEKDKKRMKNTSKEYVVLSLSCSNVCVWVHVRLTDDYNRYKNVSNNGNCILSLDDSIFNEILN